MRQVSRAEKGCNQILLYGVIAIIAGFFYGGFSDIRRYAEIELTGTPTPSKSTIPAANTDIHSHATSHRHPDPRTNAASNERRIK